MPSAEEWHEIIASKPWRPPLTIEEEQNLVKCLTSISSYSFIPAGIVGGLLTAGICSKIAPKTYLKYIGVVGGVVTMMVSKGVSAAMCFEKAVPRLLQQDREFSRPFAPNRSDLLSANDQRRNESLQLKEEPSFTVSSALEFDDPVSSVQSFSDDTSMPVLDDTEIVQPKKVATYEELRQKHREEYRNELQNRLAARNQEFRNSEYPRDKRKNKYGDEME